MSWLIDYANTFYLLFGIAAIAFVIAWRFNQRVKFLGFALGVVALMGLIWLLGETVPTDRKQVEHNVSAMAAAVVAGKMDDLFKHVSKDFRYKDVPRDKFYEMTQSAVKAHKIDAVKITDFEVDELSRERKIAKTSFRVSAWYAGSDQPYIFGTQADFALEADQWKLKTLRFYRPFVKMEPDQEFDLPFPR